VIWFLCSLSLSVVADEKESGELAKLRVVADEARKAAGKDPSIKDASSAPVIAYQAEQQRRRLTTLVGLRERIRQLSGDTAQENLLPVLKQQLADLESRPLDFVSFDSAYGYSPATGLVGYSKKVRLLENTKDGKALILVDNVALEMEGLGSSQYASGKFLGVEKAILIGSSGPDYTFRGSKKKMFSATLVDLESLLPVPPRKSP
jgi:hypothetical protein